MSSVFAISVLTIINIIYALMVNWTVCVISSIAIIFILYIDDIKQEIISAIKQKEIK